MEKINKILDDLSKSKFRSSFKLNQKDILYVQEKGFDVIEKHAYDFIDKRLSKAIILNDGKQTPYHGHPVFISQHATATCCRNCLYKWHHIEKNRDLTNEEKIYIVNIIMEWIKRNLNNR